MRTSLVVLLNKQRTGAWSTVSIHEGQVMNEGVDEWVIVFVRFSVGIKAKTRVF